MARTLREEAYEKLWYGRLADILGRHVIQANYGSIGTENSAVAPSCQKHWTQAVEDLLNLRPEYALSAIPWFNMVGTYFGGWGPETPEGLFCKMQCAKEAGIKHVILWGNRGTAQVAAHWHRTFAVLRACRRGLAGSLDYVDAGPDPVMPWETDEYLKRAGG